MRGSGTSGYVQKNAAAVPKHRQNLSWEASVAREEKIAARKPVIHVADRDILDHERKKKVEIAVLEWAEAAGILDAEYVAISPQFYQFSSPVNIVPLFSSGLPTSKCVWSPKSETEFPPNF